MEWNAKCYEGGASTRSATTAIKARPAEPDFEDGLPGGVVASEEEFAHFNRWLKSPKTPSPTLLQGAALLRAIEQKRRGTA